MEKRSAIGLDPEKQKILSEQLNVLLAEYQVFYMSVRGFHWNIKGDKFFELHAKFEELYNDLQAKVDEIAERILTLGNVPMHTFEDYLKVSKIKEAKNVSDGKECMKDILHKFQDIIVRQREIFVVAGETGDEGTGALMSDYIREQEKLIWMYTSYLK